MRNDETVAKCSLYFRFIVLLDFSRIIGFANNFLCIFLDAFDFAFLKRREIKKSKDCVQDVWCDVLFFFDFRLLFSFVRLGTQDNATLLLSAGCLHACTIADLRQCAFNLIALLCPPSFLFLSLPLPLSLSEN